MVPNWMVRRHDISLHAIVVYVALASHSGPGGIHPNRATIAAEARCSVRQVARALAELEDLGVIVRVRRKSSVGRAPTGYELRPNGHLAADETREGVEDSESLTSEVEDSQSSGMGLSVQTAPYIEEEPIEEETPIVPTPERLFEEAWVAWPKRTEKKLSRTRFVRALAKRPTLVEDVQRFGAAYAATTDVQFVPALAVWIGRERWDEPLPSGRGARPGTVDAGRQADAILRAREGDRQAIAS